MKNITTIQGILNPYEEAVKTHVPGPGDIYVTRNPSCNSHDIIRLTEKMSDRSCWKYKQISGHGYENQVSEETLIKYYRPLLNGWDDVLSMATLVTEGRTAEVVAAMGLQDSRPETNTEELMATQTPEHIKALLDASQRAENKLKEIKIVADILIEAKKAEMEARLREADKVLGDLTNKVRNISKVISILNLYTGRTVDLHRITEGDDAQEDEPLCLRQRILFMDEELCVHIEYEADYKDAGLFFDWLKEPANRDIVIPEPRSIVTLKPKRFSMDYRSGDPRYDAIRNEWNRHTYILLRNGDNLWWAESDDLEVWDWAFPHEDFEQAFLDLMSDPKTHFKDNEQRKHEAVRFRVTKFMTFIQGLLDQRPDVIGRPTVRPDLLKLKGVRLIRDDENLIGTGRLPWKDFLQQKNALIRRGTRIVYIPGREYYMSSGGPKETDSGEFLRYYGNRFARPQFPPAGLYNADTAEVVKRYENGKPVTGVNDKLVIKFLPGDEVYDRTEYSYRGRKRRESWVFNPRYVINYDAVSLEELQGYLDDRTQRPDFASMIPVLLETKRNKVREEADEKDFKRLLSEDIRRETGRTPERAVLDDAVLWWKEKTIFSRPLRSDDAKAWRMIRQKVISHNNENKAV